MPPQLRAPALAGPRFLFRGAGLFFGESMAMTEYQKLAHDRHEQWIKTDRAKRDFRASYDHLRESDYKGLVNMIFEFAEDLGYEMKPRNIK